MIHNLKMTSVVHCALLTSIFLFETLTTSGEYVLKRAFLLFRARFFFLNEHK
jgi:hypothetical protein